APASRQARSHRDASGNRDAASGRDRHARARCHRNSDRPLSPMVASFTPDEIRTALGPDLISETPGSATFFHSVTNDSRVAQRGQLFVALRTEERDGHAFVADAVSKDVAGV